MLRYHFNRQRVIILAVFICVAVLLVCVVLANPPTGADKIYIHTTIHGVPVGGFTRQQAKDALHERYQPELNLLFIEYTLNGETVAKRGYETFDARFDFSEVVEKALHYSQTRNLWRQITRLLGRPFEINISPVFRFDPAKVEAQVNQIAESLHRPPVNARLQMDNGKIVILPESIGQTIDTTLAIEETTALLLRLSQGTIALTPQQIPPRYTSEDFTFTVSVLGSYQTPIIGDFSEPRTRNIQRAAERIHNQILLPGEIFSAGTVIGAYLPDSGYEAALVLVKGEPVEDIGGGVCQVATTLYNAVLRAELPVVERHNHSARVSYVDFGFDATLAGDWFDLKFRNPSSHPILITASITGNRLSIVLHGFESRPSGRMIRFSNERTHITSPEPYKEIADADLPTGERLIMLEAVSGYTYDVFKHIYLNGNETERIKVNTSVYIPLQGVMHVGTG
jgi:vancomycin resistance protein YoaR